MLSVVLSILDALIHLTNSIILNYKRKLKKTASEFNSRGKGSYRGTEVREQWIETSPMYMYFKLWYNIHTIKFAIGVFRTLKILCNLHHSRTQFSFQNTCIIPKEILYSFSSHSPSPPPHPWQPLTCFLSIDLSILDVSQKQNHTMMSGFFCYHNPFTFQDFIPF